MTSYPDYVLQRAHGYGKKLYRWFVRRNVIRGDDGKRSQQPTESVLLTDEFHINPKNFPSLYKALAHSRYSVTIGIHQGTPPAALIHANGQYDCVDAILPYLNDLRHFTFDQIASLTYHNVNVFDCAVHEALSVALVSNFWQSRIHDKSRDALLTTLWRHDHATLLHCCAASMYWLDYWTDLRASQRFKFAIVFSGSYIYSATLMALLRFSGVRCFRCESFMTGFDYFFEEGYIPLPNNSVFRHANEIHATRRDSKIDSDPDGWGRDVIRAFNKLRGMRNKNVSQPEPAPLPKPLRKTRIALVLGQVVNDFSIISGCGSVISTIPAYTALMDSLLGDAETHIIFKAHPWERKRANVMGPFTEEALRGWHAQLPDEQKRRVYIYNDWNLDQLFSVASVVFTLCSQAGIEAAANGFRPFTIGGAFYDAGGFTASFTTPEAAAEAYVNRRIDPLLSLDDFARFESWLTLLLQTHLVNTDASGIKKIQHRLRRYNPQRHVATRYKETALQPRWL